MLTEKKKIRNNEIYLEIATGSPKEETCNHHNLSKRQLNRILSEANRETEAWFRSLPKKTIIHIFRNNCNKIFKEIQSLQQIRDSINDPMKKFEMTKGVISAYVLYNKTLIEGPSLLRQKEIIEKAEKILEQK